MTTGRKIKFAVAGYGHIGKQHAAIISSNPACELVAIADIKDRNSIGLPENGTAFFPSVEALLSSNIEVDVVAIATPNGLHEQHALIALKAGCHIIIEKPMALTKAGCERIIHEAQQQQKQVFCVMQNRYSPPSVWLKDILSKKILGQIFIVQINCYWNRDERYYTKANWHGIKELDGGTLFTQFSHFIDMLYWLFGDIQNIQAKLKDFNHQHLTDFEDSGFINFDFVEGGMGCINFSTSVWNNNLESSLTIIGENGTVKVTGQYMNEVETCNIKNYKMPVLQPTNPPNDYGQYKGSAANHDWVYKNVAGVLNGQESITTTAAEGMKVVEIIEAIYQQT